jgi:26S proteasome regulatory subunit T5
MSTIPPGEHPNGDGQRTDAPRPDPIAPTDTQPELAEMDTTPDQPEETWDDIPEEIMELDTEDVLTRIRLIENDIKVCHVTFLGVNQFNVGTRLCAQSSCG